MAIPKNSWINSDSDDFYDDKTFANETNLGDAKAYPQLYRDVSGGAPSGPSAEDLAAEAAGVGGQRTEIPEEARALAKGPGPGIIEQVRRSRDSAIPPPPSRTGAGAGFNPQTGAFAPGPRPAPQISAARQQIFDFANRTRAMTRQGK